MIKVYIPVDTPLDQLIEWHKLNAEQAEECNMLERGARYRYTAELLAELQYRRKIESEKIKKHWQDKFL